MFNMILAALVLFGGIAGILYCAFMVGKSETMVAKS